jgi:hypothetical protein
MPKVTHPKLSSNKRHSGSLFGVWAAVGLALTATLIGVTTPGMGQVGSEPNAISAGVHERPNPLASLPTIPWEGGPAYWSKFPKANAARWTDPGFFPISVFMGKPEHAAELKSIGINTYMGAEHDGSPISMITNQGVFVIAQDEWTQAEIGSDSNTVAWFISDECDIGLGCTGANAKENLVDQRNKVARVHAFGDGRFTMANYSNGVLDTYWAQGSMAELVNLVDVASVDKYAYTSPFVDNQMIQSPHWPVGANPVSAASYGWLADRLRAYQNPIGGHPNWVFIEAAMPLLNDPGSLTITPAQIEGAVWSAIIHEARGLAYFQHNNGSTCGFYSLVQCDQARLDRIKTINAGVQSLAPVINTQSYQFSFNDTTNTMLKAYEGSAYIFADIGLGQSPGLKHFVLPPGVTGSTVEVVGENRTLPVSGNAFSDTFDSEYSHHTYKVSF